MLRCGEEAFFRIHLGIENRRDHNKVNPFYRGSAGGPAIEMVASPQVRKSDLHPLTSNLGKQNRFIYTLELSSSSESRSLPSIFVRGQTTHLAPVGASRASIDASVSMVVSKIA